ncbi:MAG: DUF1841 family protein [Proteobacteria bacterium]|nr:DUF1841 family protein [Pseudomonadota bacterium]
MIYAQDRREMRRVFVNAWGKYRAQQALEAMEQHIVDVVLLHPEYHALLADEATALDSDYTPEQGASNPFLHMGLHIAIREQLTTRRPPEVNELYQHLLAKLRDAHEAEHRMLECLGEVLWRAQRDGVEPDVAEYVMCLRRATGLKAS